MAMDTAVAERFETLWRQVQRCFSRRDLQRRAKGYLRGLLLLRAER